MPDAPTPNRTRLAATAGLLGAATVAALVLGAGPAPSVLQLAGASDDVADDVSGNCDEAEHANDPACQGTTDDAATTSSTVIGTTSTSVDGTTSTTAGGGAGGPADEIRSLDAAGAGIVIYAIEGDSLRLVTATPASGWAVEVEHRTGREVELDFRSGAQRVQVNVEIEDGQVRERVRVRDDADDTDVRIENGVVVRDDSPDDDSSGPGRGNDDSDDDSNSGSGHGGDDDGHASDDDSGSGHGGSGSG